MSTTRANIHTQLITPIVLGGVDPTHFSELCPQRHGWALLGGFTSIGEFPRMVGGMSE
jgi:hypothetical protein